jgi:hypothetical protein
VLETQRLRVQGYCLQQRHTRLPLAYSEYPNI